MTQNIIQNSHTHNFSGVTKIELLSYQKIEKTPGHTNSHRFFLIIAELKQILIDECEEIKQNDSIF